jgi:hypothetical protein
MHPAALLFQLPLIIGLWILFTVPDITKAAEVILVPAADLQAVEYNNTPQNTGNGTGTQLNARFAASVNEVIALRFDLTGYDRSQLTAASLNLINFRNNTARVLHYWGVKNGATGMDISVNPPVEGLTTDNDWPETGTKFSDLPGVEYDALPTRGIALTRVSDLGSATMNSGIEGTICSYAPRPLVDFLKTHADGIVTIIISVDTSSNGQSKFASKETTVLQAGGAAQPAGTFSPRLVLTITDNSVDRDKDGLLNAWESANGFDPDEVDTDGDTVPDGLEDGDTDGLNNLGEQARGTNPADPDTDADTLSDNVETATGTWQGLTNTGTSPLLADTDLDTLPDAVENPDLPFMGASQPGTNPNRSDSDSDLYSDPAELLRGSSPKVAASVPDGAVLTILGTGTASLLGHDLSDPGNDIDDRTPEGARFNWLQATATSKAFFGTGVQADPTSMGAFDLFDNKLGPVNDKWCCGGPPVSATLEFPGTVSLTHFTIASPDDRPERDPVNWQIQGSNDGVTFEPVFTQADPNRTGIWTARLQVVRCQLAAASAAYRYIRYECTAAVSGQHALGELEFFGTMSLDSPPKFNITGVSRDPQTGALSLTWESVPGRSYRVEYSTTPESFTLRAVENIPAGAQGNTTSVTFNNPSPGVGSLFLRVAQE